MTGLRPRGCPRCGSLRPCSPLLPLELLEDVVELLALGVQVALVVPVRLYLYGHPLDDLEPEALQAHDLGEVVGHEAYAAQPQFLEDLGPYPVVPEVRGEPEPLVGLDGVEPLVLQVVGLHLVQEPYTAAFLLHVDDYPLALFGYRLHRGF